MGAAKALASGAIAQLDRPAEADEVLSESDVQAPDKLARVLRRLLSNVTSLMRRTNPARIDFEDVVMAGEGASVRLPHHFGSRARWSVVGWQGDTSRSPWDDALWIHRAFFGPGTLTSGAANSTVGCRFQVSSKTRVAGARVAWRSSGGLNTLKVSLWRDSDGARLASGTAEVSNSGAYVIAFDSPVILDGADLGVNLTISVYDTGGANYTYTAADAAWAALLSLQLPGVLLQAVNLVGNPGDIRPTVAAGAENYWVEPLFATPHAQLVEDTASTDDNTLALKSYAPGIATIRVEEAG